MSCYIYLKVYLDYDSYLDRLQCICYSLQGLDLAIAIIFHSGQLPYLPLVTDLMPRFRSCHGNFLSLFAHYTSLNRLKQSFLTWQSDLFFDRTGHKQPLSEI